MTCCFIESSRPTHTPRFRTTSTGWIVSVATVKVTSWCCNLARLCLEARADRNHFRLVSAIDEMHTTSRNQLCSEICADECQLCWVDSSRRTRRHYGPVLLPNFTFITSSCGCRQENSANKQRARNTVLPMLHKDVVIGDTKSSGANKWWWWWWLMMINCYKRRQYFNRCRNHLHAHSVSRLKTLPGSRYHLDSHLNDFLNTIFRAHFISFINHIKIIWSVSAPLLLLLSAGLSYIWQSGRNSSPMQAGRHPAIQSSRLQCSTRLRSGSTLLHIPYTEDLVDNNNNNNTTFV